MKGTRSVLVRCFCFFFNDPAPTEIYTLSLHDALPICRCRSTIRERGVRQRRAPHEAGTAGAHGARLPVSASFGTYRHQGDGEGSIDGTESSPIRIPVGLQ